MIMDPSDEIASAGNRHERPDDSCSRGNLEQLPEGLMMPDAYPHQVDAVTRQETHISWLFFAGDRVYKVKKPVDLGFLDFTTTELRKYFCEEEVRLNQRFPGGVHLGVVPVVRRPNGSIKIGGPGPLVDWAVAMRQLPARRMLDRLLERGEVDNGLLDRLVDVLVPFHAAAATGVGVDAYGTPDAIARLARDNIESLASRTGPAGVMSPALHGLLARELERSLGELRPVFAWRVEEGRVREGHGDLHSGNICYESDGPVLYDCIEFSRALRCCDVAADIAFLAMDLDARGYLGFSQYLLRRYLDRSEDAGISAVIGFYKSYRALVRAKVAALRLDEPALGSEEREEARREGARYARLAGSYAVAPALVLTCGLPGSGKSWLASRIDVPHDARVLRSDVVRKRLAGIPPSTRVDSELESGLYTPDVKARTYAELLRDSESYLRAGRSVIVDAAFMRREERQPFMDLARDSGVSVAVLWVDAADAVVRERLLRRADDPNEASDADEHVYDWARKVFEPPTEIDVRSVVLADGCESPEQVSANVLDCLASESR